MSNGMMGYILAFSIGAAAGVAVTCKVLRDKYEQEIQNEIAELRAMRLKTDTGEQEPEKEHDTKADTTNADYLKVLDNAGYTKYGEAAANLHPVEDIPDQPYVITPDEFAMIGYKVESLVYYTDDVLADDAMRVVDDLDGTVGEESLSRFGEYEDDAVHVRNDLLRTDYEILRSMKSYSEALASVHIYDVEE